MGYRDKAGKNLQFLKNKSMWISFNLPARHIHVGF